ncbi:MAG: lanthionine synthetase LanC family protein [Gemmatimonas sp.]
MTVLAAVENCLRVAAGDVEAGTAHVSPWLAGGAAGAALWYAEANRRGVLRHGNDTERWLEIASEAMSAATPSAGLWEGLAGLAWIHLHTAAPEASPVDEADLVDALIGYMRASRAVDLLGGAAGLLMLAAALRDERERARLAAVCIDVLAAARVTDGAICLWPSADPVTGEEAFDLGVAHGAPGIIAALATVVSVNLGGLAGRDLYREALEAFVALLERLCQLPHLPHAFTVHNRVHRAPPRLGWCYGDLGVSATLGYVESRLGNPRVALLRSMLNRRLASRRHDAGIWSGVGLCHGAAGFMLFGGLCIDDIACDVGVASRVWGEIESAADSDALTKAEDGSAECLVGLLAGPAGIGMAALRTVAPLSTDLSWLSLFGAGQC